MIFSFQRIWSMCVSNTGGACCAFKAGRACYAFKASGACCASKAGGACTLLILLLSLNGCSNNSPLIYVTIQASDGTEIDSTRFFLDENRDLISMNFKRFFRDVFDDKLETDTQITVTTGDYEDAYQATFKITGSPAKRTLHKVKENGLTPLLMGFSTEGKKSKLSAYLNAVSDVIAAEINRHDRTSKKARKAGKAS